MKKWDVFLSHASEDKEAVVIPLADSLIRSGLRVWLDRFELKIGDSLREKIDQGLTESRFGIVVLSEHFLSKNWPRNELNGLFALEEDGTKVILPIWHGVDKATVARFSPILADRLAADTRNGMPVVARAIADALLAAGRGSTSLSDGLAAQLIRILERGPNPMAVATFLDTYRAVLPAAVGLFEEHCAEYFYDTASKGGAADLSVRFLRNPSIRIWSRIDLIFCPAGDISEGVSLDADLAKALERMKQLHRDHSDDPRNERYDGHYKSFHGQTYYQFILAGRRDSLSALVKNLLRSLFTATLEVRTYDLLIEACVKAEASREAEERRAKAQREASEKRDRDVARWEELALIDEIDPSLPEAFIASAESLLSTSSHSLKKNLDLFLPRLLRHWDFDNNRAAAILKHLGLEAVLLALQDTSILPTSIGPVLLRLIGEFKINSPSAIEILSRYVGSAEPTLRAESLGVAQELGPAAYPIVPQLLALAHEHPQIRGDVISLLGDIKDSSSRVIAFLTDLLPDASALVRLKAARALGRIGSGAASAIPAIKPLLKDESRFVRDAAKEAIRAIGP